MTTVKEHYDKHLGNIYSWMMGDFSESLTNQISVLNKLNIPEMENLLALDLGAGHGIHSVALAELGASVIAIDFNRHLLHELKNNAGKHSSRIQIIEDDILNFTDHQIKPDLILCCTDTIAHLESFDVLQKFLKDCYDALPPGGLLYLTFRDYTTELKEQDRFIPVKADDSRILSCFLEYREKTITVYDILYEKINGSWQQKISHYSKLRISFSHTEEMLKKLNFMISFKENGRMNTLIAKK